MLFRSAKRQHDILRFHRDFLREPMIEMLAEDEHWLYCTETNTKLLPRFLYDLAVEYATRGEAGYRAKLEIIKQNQMISDDGDAIVDRHSGYVIAHIEWENEELYDERGFKIKTGDVMEAEPIAEDDEIADGERGLGGAGGAHQESEDTTTVKIGRAHV